jgi:hypothetical protein
LVGASSQSFLKPTKPPAPDPLRIVRGNLGGANAGKVMLVHHTKFHFWIDWPPFLSQVVSRLLPDSIPFRPKRATWLALTNQTHSPGVVGFHQLRLICHLCWIWEPMGADATILCFRGFLQGMRLGPSGGWHVWISCSPGALFQQSVPKECLDRHLKKSAGPVTASITIETSTASKRQQLK